jgi:hypothetical protein
MDYEMLLAALLMGLLVFFSLDFDKHYASMFRDSAHQPFARFLAGLAVCVIASINPFLAITGLMIVFFWIADVHLLSSFVLP